MQTNNKEFPYEEFGVEKPPNTIAKMVEDGTIRPMVKGVKFKVAEVDSLIKEVTAGTITFSRFVEIINERI